MSGVDSTLAFIDQASFLGLRALGRGPLIQFTWIYRRAVDVDGLERFRENLGRGLLGRRIERSALPFGRHRWIAWPGPDGIDIAEHSRTLDQVAQWTDEQAAIPIDPEYGPSWRLAVLPLVDGGAAVTLILSHTVADAVGAAIAVGDAVNGTAADLGYPPAHARTTGKAIVEDSRAIARCVPDIGRAVVAAARIARSGDLVKPSPPKKVPSGRGGSRSVTLPSVTAQVDLSHWDDCAKSLGGTSNSLLLGFVARLSRRLGWAPADGPVTLSMPVNERTPNDTRGNAITTVTVTVDPAGVTTDLRPLREQVKKLLSSLDQTRDGLLAPLPLVPLTPKSVARKLEQTVIRSGVVGSSNLGELDPVVNRPDGSDADLFAVRTFEHLTLADLQRSGGAFLPVLSGRVRGKLFLSVGHANRDGSTVRADILDAVRRTLDEFELSALLY